MAVGRAYRMVGKNRIAGLQSVDRWVGSDSQAHNVYAEWGSSVAARNRDWVQTGHVTTVGGAAAGYRTSTGRHGTAYAGQNGAVVRGANDSVYEGNDGHVYRRDSSGGWSKYDNGNWNTVDTTAAKQQAQQNIQTSHPNAQQNAQSARQNVGNQYLGASCAGVQNNSTLQGLDHSAIARQRGQVQTGKFQNFNRGGGRFRR
jgi:hypothetical protein